MDQEEINQIRRELEKDLREKQEKEKIKNRQRLFIFGMSLILAAPWIGSFMGKDNIFPFFYAILFGVGGFVACMVATKDWSDSPFNL